ncbi:MAG: hypothetical protein ACYSUI_23950, partial [Planctomycetota bacterium]
MTAGDWPRIKVLLADALARDPDQRAAFLDEACAGDDDLRGHVQRLLDQDHAAQSFFKAPRTSVTAPAPHAHQRTIGRYTTRRVIAS